MGIRVHKMLGYGLTDVKHDKYTITDERFSKKFIKNLYEDWAPLEDYVAWLKKQPQSGFEGFEIKLDIRMFEDRLKKKEYFELNRCFVYQPEYGDANVFLIVVPSEFHQSYRYDDLIDYYEERFKGRFEPYYKEIDGGIYPYLSYMDCRTGRKLKDCSFVDIEKDEDYMLKCGFLKGFKDVEEFKKFRKPIIPRPIELLCKYFGVFKNSKTRLQLKPMLYVYWG